MYKAKLFKLTVRVTFPEQRKPTEYFDLTLSGESIEDVKERSRHAALGMFPDLAAVKVLSAVRTQW